jgi:hypothetical protein
MTWEKTAATVDRCGQVEMPYEHALIGAETGCYLV